MVMAEDLPIPIIRAGCTGESYKMHCLTSSLRCAQ